MRGSVWSYYAVHSLKAGTLKSVEISDAAKPKIVENHLIRKPGDAIQPFTGANTTLGCLLMKFDSMDEMLQMMDHSEAWISVELESDS